MGKDEFYPIQHRKPSPIPTPVSVPGAQTPRRSSLQRLPDVRDRAARPSAETVRPLRGRKGPGLRTAGSWERGRPEWAGAACALWRRSPGWNPDSARAPQAAAGCAQGRAGTLATLPKSPAASSGRSVDAGESGVGRRPAAGGGRAARQGAARRKAAARGPTAGPPR